MQAHKISLFLILFENLNGKKMDLKWISCSFPVQPYFIPPKRTLIHFGRDPQRRGSMKCDGNFQQKHKFEFRAKINCNRKQKRLNAVPVHNINAEYNCIT